jgi:hypothetical protein
VAACAAILKLPEITRIFSRRAIPFPDRARLKKRQGLKMGFARLQTHQPGKKAGFAFCRTLNAE